MLPERHPPPRQAGVADCVPTRAAAGARQVLRPLHTRTNFCWWTLKTISLLVMLVQGPQFLPSPPGWSCS
jgi:hypothetical protein